MSIRGSDEITSGRVTFGAPLADRLGVGAADHITAGGQSLLVDVAGAGQSATIATGLARTLVGDNGWWTVFAPPRDEKRSGAPGWPCSSWTSQAASQVLSMPR